MKYEIDGDSTKPEPTVTLRLRKQPDGSVRLYAQTRHGEDYPIIDLTPSGLIHRRSGVNANIGFQVDLSGRVKLYSFE